MFRGSNHDSGLHGTPGRHWTCRRRWLIPFHAKVRNARLKLLRLRREFLRGRRHLLGRARVLLRHLVELLDRLVDLVGADVLLAARGADLGHQFRGLA